MPLSDGAEEILELMWVAQEELNKKEISKAEIKATETHIEELQQFISELVEKALVKKQGEMFELTEKGKAEGRDTVRRHRLSERLFMDVFHVKKELIDEAACKMEHILHKGIDENICTLLGHPQVCPHGKNIPSGRCCAEDRESQGRLVSSLVDVSINAQGRIAYLFTPDTQKLHKLMAMGVLPGKEVKLLQRFPSFVFEVGNSQYAVDQEMAEGIYVRLQQK